MAAIYVNSVWTDEAAFNADSNKPADAVWGTNAFATVKSAVAEAKKSEEFVTIEIYSGEYSEGEINFSAKKYVVDGVSSVGGIAFKAAEGADVVINGNFVGSAGSDFKDITFDGLTINNNGNKYSGYYAAIYFADGYANKSASGIVINNCNITSASTAGTSIGIAFAYSTIVDGVTVTNNTIDAECAVYGGDGNLYNDITISGNTIVGSKEMVNYTYWGGVYIFKAGSDVVITDNTFSNSAFYAINVRKGEGVVIEDNDVTDCQGINFTKGSVVSGNTVDGEAVVFPAYEGTDIFVMSGIAGEAGEAVIIDGVAYTVGTNIFGDVNSAAAAAESTAGKLVVMEGTNVVYDANQWFLLNAPQREIEEGIWNYDVVVDASETYDLQINGTLSAYQLLLNNAETVVSSTGKLFANSETMRIMGGTFTVDGVREAGAAAPAEIFTGSWGGGTKPGADTQIKAGYIQINQGAAADFNNTVVFVNAGWMNFNNAAADFSNSYIYLGSGGSYAPIAVELVNGADVSFADNTTLINDKTFTMNITVDATSSLTVDADSFIQATTLTVAEGGKFIIDAEGFSGFKKVVDLSGSESLEGKVTVKGEGASVFYGADGDVVVGGGTII